MTNDNLTIEILEWIKVIVLAIVISLIIRSYVFEIVRVDGPSMQKTLYTNERVYIEKIFYRFSAPKRGDIVECYFTKYDKKNQTYIKRILGLGGETVEIKDGKIYINNKEYDDPYYDDYEKADDPIQGKWEVPENCVFVVGDNRGKGMSRDSRMIGSIPREDVLGKAVFIVWPFDKAKILK